MSFTPTAEQPFSPEDIIKMRKDLDDARSTLRGIEKAESAGIDVSAQKAQMLSQISKWEGLIRAYG